MNAALPEVPNYFSSQFPRDNFPLYGWPSRPPSFPENVWTTETTHRDGQQGGLPLSTAQSLQIYDLLCRFTGPSGAIRQAEFFIYRPADLRAFRTIQERPAQGAPIEPTTWIRATAKDVQLVVSLGVRESGLLASISDYHVFHKFRPGGRQQAAEMYLDAVNRTLDAGIRPRLHLEDISRADIDFVRSFVQSVLERASQYPGSLRPKFRVCDTLGLALPDEEVPLPRGIPKLIQALRAAGLESVDLEFHPHNDSGLIVANCLSAIRHGCAVINGTCLGKGERTGNAPLELILFHLIGMGYYQRPPPDFKVLNELATLYQKMGQPISDKYPLYGRDAHRTRAGIHADGLNKFWWMYAPFDVPRLIGRPLEVSLTKDCGIAGLVFVARQHLQANLEKDNPMIERAHRWMLAQFEEGRQTAIEWEEVEKFFR